MPLSRPASRRDIRASATSRRLPSRASKRGGQMDAARTIVAVTGEDDRYTRVREEAIERALADHATLILYDLDAGRDPLESPLPTEWSAEGTDEDVADRLGPDELEAA